MKIVINYDLLDKIREANTGFSLIRSFKRTLFYTGIQSAFVLLDNVASGDSLESIFMDIIICLSAHVSLTGVNAVCMAKIYQDLANKTLDSLLVELNANCIKTERGNISSSYKYKTEYSLRDEASIFPRLEQRKHIMVPVHDDWGDREMALVQDHIIGTNEYVLSLGSEKEKVYSLVPRTMKQV